MVSNTLYLAADNPWPFPQPFWMACLFLVGLIIGSFLNVVALRQLSNESIVFPASHCPKCQKPLAWFDNIPIISYLCLQGRCRQCRTSISLQYPLVELATGMLFVLVGAQFGYTWATPTFMALVAQLMVVTITDWKESFVYLNNTLPMVPVGIGLNLLMPGLLAAPLWLPVHGLVGEWHVPGLGLTLGWSVLSSVLGVLLPVVFFESLILISKWALKTDGFGHGDTWLMMAIGAYLGVERCALALLLGFIIQTVVAVPVLLWQWIRQRQYVSLGSGVGAFVCSLLPLGLTGTSLPPMLQQATSLTSIALTIILLVVFLKQVRYTERHTYLPLGPALVLGSLLILFLI